MIRIIPSSTDSITNYTLAAGENFKYFYFNHYNMDYYYYLNFLILVTIEYINTRNNLK
jgi:hypothetical protein